MISRRDFLTISARAGIGSAGLVLTNSSLANTLSASGNNTNRAFIMPDESAQHRRTWMAYVANSYVWSKQQIPAVKSNLIAIATTIAQYEPVSMLVSPKDYAEAHAMITAKPSQYPIELVIFAVDDLWLRDTGPTFVYNNQGEKFAIDFNFNGWGNKQEHSLDRHVAQFITQTTGASPLNPAIVLEGGCFEVDGQGTAILTKSCVVNDNRNPYMTIEQAETILKPLLGLSKIIWLEGIKGKDITDGHTDFYARFLNSGTVLASRDNYQKSYDYQVTRDNIEILKNSTDANGNPLQVSIIDTPDQINTAFGEKDFAAGYIGYYLCNGAVISQKFGDAYADKQAYYILQQAFPDRVIEQLAIDGIASGGGSIHCATQQEI